MSIEVKLRFKWFQIYIYERQNEGVKEDRVWKKKNRKGKRKQEGKWIEGDKSQNKRKKNEKKK